MPIVPSQRGRFTDRKGADFLRPRFRRKLAARSADVEQNRTKSSHPTGPQLVFQAWAISLGQHDLGRSELPSAAAGMTGLTLSQAPNGIHLISIAVPPSTQSTISHLIPPGSAPSSVGGVRDQIWIAPGVSDGHFSPMAGLTSI